MFARSNWGGRGLAHFILLLHPDRLKERLDFMLKEGMVENSYLNSITAHTSYWTSQDVAMFLLLQLYSYQRSHAAQ